MSSTSSNKKDLFISPDIYESSYKDIFRCVDFNISFFSKVALTKKVGRLDYLENALFGVLVLKNLALNSSFRTIEAIISQDSELAMLIGFDDWDTPSESILRRYFSALTLEKIEMAQDCLLKALQALAHPK